MTSEGTPRDASAVATRLRPASPRLGRRTLHARMAARSLSRSRIGAITLDRHPPTRHRLIMRLSTGAGRGIRVRTDATTTAVAERPDGLSDFAYEWMFGDGDPGGIPFAGGAALAPRGDAAGGGPEPAAATRPEPRLPAPSVPGPGGPVRAPRGRVQEGPAFRVSASPPLARLAAAPPGPTPTPPDVTDAAHAPRTDTTPERAPDAWPADAGAEGPVAPPDLAEAVTPQVPTAAGAPATGPAAPPPTPAAAPSTARPVVIARAATRTDLRPDRRPVARIHRRAADPARPPARVPTLPPATPAVAPAPPASGGLLGRLARLLSRSGAAAEPATDEPAAPQDASEPATHDAHPVERPAVEVSSAAPGVGDADAADASPGTEAPDAPTPAAEHDEEGAHPDPTPTATAPPPGEADASAPDEELAAGSPPSDATADAPPAEGARIARSPRTAASAESPATTPRGLPPTRPAAVPPAPLPSARPRLMPSTRRDAPAPTAPTVSGNAAPPGEGARGADPGPAPTVARRAPLGRVLSTLRRTFTVADTPTTAALPPVAAGETAARPEPAALTPVGHARVARAWRHTVPSTEVAIPGFSEFARGAAAAPVSSAGAHAHAGATVPAVAPRARLRVARQPATAPPAFPPMVFDRPGPFAATAAISAELDPVASRVPPTTVAGATGAPPVIAPPTPGIHRSARDPGGPQAHPAVSARHPEPASAEGVHDPVTGTAGRDTGTGRGVAGTAGPDADDIYERVVERLRRELLSERERMGDLLGDMSG